MSDSTAEILSELRKLRQGQQAILHILYGFNTSPNPVPWLGFSVLAGSDVQGPPACPAAEACLRAFSEAPPACSPSESAGSEL